MYPPTATDIATSRAPEPAEVPTAHSDSPHFVEQELDDLESPFTRETVLVLNAIVSRSLNVIQEFDKTRTRLSPLSDQYAAELTDTYAGLSARASAARRDMEVAGDRLRNSGEHYNEAIFAAMVHFVEDVDDEIREEIETLRQANPTGSD